MTYMAKDVASVKEAGAVVAFDYGQHAGGGFENQTSSDVAVPYLSVLQSLSPQVEDGPFDSGQIFNTVTEEAYDGEVGVRFIPCYTEHLWVEWTPRTQGGGLVARYLPGDPIIARSLANPDEKGKPQTPAGNHLVETFYLYGLVDDGSGSGLTPAVIGCSSTKITQYKKINTKLASFMLPRADGSKYTPPIFCHQLLVRTRYEKRTAGNSYNFDFTPLTGEVKDSLLDPSGDDFAAAMRFCEVVKSGKAAPVEGGQDAGGSSEGGSTPF